jgi:hypothetical protein
MDTDEERRKDRLIEILGKTLDYVANEAVVLNRLEEFFSPKPAKLATSDAGARELQDRIDHLVESLGGPPKTGTTSPNLVKVDSYPLAAISEAINMFHRTRKSVVRTHMFMIGVELQNKWPDAVKNSNEEDREFFLESSESAFWEHGETSFIRLVAYWDRIGQILDFAFFGIRQFERDGFSSVMDRIHCNWVPMSRDLGAMAAWKRLRVFQTSESEDGLKWLVRRRNLLVHSLHLRAVDSRADEEMIDSLYNHLELSLRKKLAPGTVEQELRRIHQQLSAAASLFPDFLSLCEYAPRHMLSRLGIQPIHPSAH